MVIERSKSRVCRQYALIVIQREWRRSALFAEMEHGIGRNRPDSVDPHLPGRFHRRDQIVSLFVTKQTIVGTMRVQGGHGNARILMFRAVNSWWIC